LRIEYPFSFVNLIARPKAETVHPNAQFPGSLMEAIMAAKIVACKHRKLDRLPDLVWYDE
jgi:hypothetical protein